MFHVQATLWCTIRQRVLVQCLYVAREVRFQGFGMDDMESSHLGPLPPPPEGIHVPKAFNRVFGSCSIALSCTSYIVVSISDCIRYAHACMLPTLEVTSQIFGFWCNACMWPLMDDSKFLTWMILKIIGRQSAFSPEEIQVPKACNRVCWVLLHSSSMCNLHCGVPLATMLGCKCLYVAHPWGKIPGF